MRIRACGRRYRALPATGVASWGAVAAVLALGAVVAALSACTPRLAGSRTLSTFTGHTDVVTSVAFSPDGKTVASGCADSRSVNDTVWLWNVASGRATATLSGQNTSVAFSPDGKTLAIGGLDGAAHLWDLAAGQPAATFV